MVFQNIFDTSDNVSAAGGTAAGGISGYLATEPAESKSVPPHDPWQPVESDVPQNPKIVRETSPQARGLFNLISTLASTIKQATDTQQTATSDPASTVSVATSIMGAGESTSRQAGENLTKPTVTPPQAPTVVPPPVVNPPNSPS